MIYFVHTPDGQLVEVDYTKKAWLPSGLNGCRHPHPQHWEDISHEARERDEHRCVACHSSKRVEVHHRTYQRFGNEKLSDVYCLCRECHEVFHQERRLAA